jgi:uncharacterized protein (DUF697 family)
MSILHKLEEIMDDEMKKAEDVKVTISKDQQDPDRVIFDHVGFSLIAGAIPIPVVDVIAISAIQIDMIRQLSKIYNIDFDDEIGKTLVTSIVGSTFGLSIGSFGASAVKAVPVFGSILGIASQVILAGITTYAVGFIFNSHFRDHKTLVDFNFNDVKDAFEDLLKKGKEYVDGFMKNAEPNKEKMKEETAIVLRSMYEKGFLKKEDLEKILNGLNGSTNNN